MSFESDVYTALTSLVSGRVYPDVAPLGATRPYITYQKVGGTAWNFLESANVGKRNARLQVNCWSDTRLATASLARAAEIALVESTTIRAYILGAVVDSYEDETTPPLYGSMQDFSVAY